MKRIVSVVQLSQSQNYGPNNVTMVTLYSIDSTTIIGYQAIITNPTPAMCRIKQMGLIHMSLSLTHTHAHTERERDTHTHTHTQT